MEEQREAIARAAIARASAAIAAAAATPTPTGATTSTVPAATGASNFTTPTPAGGAVEQKVVYPVPYILLLRFWMSFLRYCIIAKTQKLCTLNLLPFL